MAVDALMSLQTSVTKTAVFNGAALILPGGTPRRGLKARVVYSAASTSAGAGAASFGIDASYDGGVTWTMVSQAPALVLSTTAMGGEVALPFEISPTSVVNGTQIRLSLESISGTTATVTYIGDLMLSRP